MRVTTRNARFQQWEALLRNRNKRQRGREFLVHGVRPIGMAVRYGWTFHALLYRDDARLSSWATNVLDESDALKVALAPQLLAELGEKDDEMPELVGVAEMPADRLGRIPSSPDMLVVVFDRPASPGNIGTVIRSADAFGAAGVIVTGHAADIYDPKAVRASTGSLFAIPVVRAGSHAEVLDWMRDAAAEVPRMKIVGTDEHGGAGPAEVDLTGPTMLLVGNETIGLTAAWRAACDEVLSIPMAGSASSLNAAVAASVSLYEADRQRRANRVAR
jgi:tRNA G18 (ribose-2'-O)-methylase SpoU